MWQLTLHLYRLMNKSTNNNRSNYFIFQQTSNLLIYLQGISTLESRDAQSSPKWRTAHHSGSGGGKSGGRPVVSSSCELRTTLRLPEL